MEHPVVTESREVVDDVFRSIKTGILSVTIFLFPLFFLPITQEYFVTNKLYLLAASALLLIAVSILELLVTRRFVYRATRFDLFVGLAVIAVAAATFVTSPNSRQALLNPSFGLVSIASLAVIYFYLSRDRSLFGRKSGRNIFESRFFYLQTLSAVIVSLVSFAFFFEPFRDTKLNNFFAFFKSANFNMLGSSLDLMVYLGLSCLYLVIMIFNNNIEIEGTHSSIKEVKDPNSGSIHKVYVQHSKKIYQFDMFFIVNTICLIITLVSFSLAVYNTVKPTIAQDANNQAQKISLLNSLTPYSLSWYAALETLKSPMTAVFGNGIDNFSSVFTRIKRDTAYNQSATWQIQNYALSRSAFLHIFTESGLFGLLAFGVFFYAAFTQLLSHPLNKGQRFAFLSLVSIFFTLLLLPPSLVSFYLFFLSIGFYVNQSIQNSRPHVYESGAILPVYIITLIISIIGVSYSSYYLSQTYVAEYYFKRSLDGFLANNGAQLYDNQRQAILINPYIERYRLSFSQTNLLFANTIASKALKKDGDNKISDKDRQDITQAIQAAIAEAKQAVGLNPQKASNWENLAVIYQNVLSIAQGADVWTIAAYQRAIALDDQNPIYRLNLGSVYFSLGNFEDATRMFEQAVLLKSDWPNGHYNLAWSAIRKQDYKRAHDEMQTTVSLLDPVKDKADYERANQDLQDINKKLAEFEKKSGSVAGAETSDKTPPKLNLPTPPTATLEPKLRLDKEAQPPPPEVQLEK